MNEKIEIIKIGKEYYEKYYKINVDVPLVLYLPQYTFCTNEEEDTYYFEYWEYVVTGSWNRKLENKLKYYAPVYKNARNKYIRLDSYVYEDDTVEKAQKKVNKELKKIKEQLIEIENEYLKKLERVRFSLSELDKQQV